VGVAIKARSGSDAVRPSAARAVLDRVFPGFLREPVPARFVDVFSLVGTRVGELAAVFRG
jgi:hypothetical protein